MTLPGGPRRCTAISPRRCSMARRRASMREGPLAELFRATEAAQRQGEGDAPAGAAPPEAAPAQEPEERTVEHVPTWEEAAQLSDAAAAVPAPEPPAPAPDPMPPPPRPDPGPPAPGPHPWPDPFPEPPPQMHVPAPAPPPPPVSRYVE